MSDSIDHDFPSPHVDVPVERKLNAYVRTTQFDLKCLQKARKSASSSSDESGSSSDCFSNSSISSATTVDSSPYDVPELEANLYYAGLGPRGSGPKLIYRTSEDVFEEPSGPEAYKRLMTIVSVPDSHDFGSDVTWDAIRDQVVVFLDQRNIIFTSVDFVRFTWLKKYDDRVISPSDDNDDNDDNDDEEEEQELSYDDIPRIQPVEYEDRHYTNPTIWIGVNPKTLTGAIAHDASKDIRVFLDSLLVRNIDIAFRESIYKQLSHGPALFPPLEESDTLKTVIDNVSVALSIPIAGLSTTMQGTLGPYFHVGSELFAITVRHNVFAPSEGNDEYNYHNSAPKKEVIVMGSHGFKNYLASIQVDIGNLIDATLSLEKKIATLRTLVQCGIDIDKSQKKLGERETELANTRIKIEDLKKFFVNIKKRWSKAKDRVIGFVRWAPPLGVGVAPHRYTRDLCVIQLDKKKFKAMIGNVLSLGPEMSEEKFNSLIYERDDVRSDFKYPVDGLHNLKHILTAAQVNNPTNLNLQGDRVRRVLKRGFTTKTTVGTLTRFFSVVRKYFAIGKQESLEVVIFTHEHDLGTFSKGGDSGSLIVSSLGEFLALLTGGAYTGTNSSDITYATLFEWVWDLVKAKFPGADLYFDNMEEFLSDVC